MSRSISRVNFFFNSYLPTYNKYTHKPYIEISRTLDIYIYICIDPHMISNTTKFPLDIL